MCIIGYRTFRFRVLLSTSFLHQIFVAPCHKDDKLRSPTMALSTTYPYVFVIINSNKQ